VPLTAKEMSRMSSADDSWEILQLLHLYAHAVDAGDFETFGGLFAKGTFRIPGHTMRGADEVKRHARESVLLYDGSPRTNHFVQNPLIEIDPDQRTARVSSYVQVLQEVPPDFPLQTIATARYRDRLRRDEAGWRFEERVAEVIFVGDLSRHTKVNLEPGAWPS
jgi:hypothetical protein